MATQSKSSQAINIKGFLRGWYKSIEETVLRAKYFVHSLRSAPIDQSRSIHLLLMKRNEYILPAINCANSIWYHSPHSKITIWCDVERKAQLNTMLKRFSRSDRILIKSIPFPDREWQFNKMEIISSNLHEKDLFSDVDLIWNGKPPVPHKPLFFVSEYDMRNRTITRWLLKKLNCDFSRPWLMLNVSVVGLADLAMSDPFSSRVRSIYEEIRNVSVDEILGIEDLPSLHRMSEQMAYSIAIQEKYDFEVLKQTDSYMDGGLAESFYLGAINGYD